MALSCAQRLNSHSIDVRVNTDPVLWFASPPRDTRLSPCRPLYHSFRRAKWTDVKKPERRQYVTERLPREAHADPGGGG